MVEFKVMTEIKASPNIKCCDKHLKFRLAVSAGLEIGHFEKTQGEKTQNSRKNSITQGKNSRSWQIFAEYCYKTMCFAIKNSLKLVNTQ